MLCLSYSSSSYSKVLITLLLSIFLFQSYQHECVHDQTESDLKISDHSYALYSETSGRFLKEYQNISILIDTSTLTGVSAAFKQYVAENLMPAVTNYLEATLKVPERTSKLKAGGYSSLCSGEVKVPKKYNTDGVDADLIIFVLAKNDPSAAYVAAASSCLLDTTTRRPIVGKMTYNIARISATTNDAQREKDIVTTLHEMTHALGFSGSLYQYYVNPITGDTLNGHIIGQKILGFNTVVLSLEPLTTRLRAHFNCPSIQGAFIENQGGTGSAGSHFERRVFHNEYMTGSSILDARITEFTLALLEGTGWYQINYDMAEPITWGKNEGCDFYKGPCVDKATKKPNFKEFCSSLAQKSCSWTKRAGSSCGAFKIMTNPNLPSEINWWGNKTISQDTFSDNCPLLMPYNNLDCEDPDNEDGATLGAESYGYGSKCFMGTLYSGGELSTPYPYCFKSQCKQDTSGDYYVQVKIGSNVINCTSASKVKVSGYSGKLTCPDPKEFCSQVLSEGYCRRKCSGRGTCVNKECICDDGWDGFDCSKSVYTDQCSKCENGDPLRTSCYGDSCECNPSNTTCMCALGLKKGVACEKIIFKLTQNVDDSSDSTETVITSSAIDSTNSTLESNSTIDATNTTLDPDSTIDNNNTTFESNSTIGTTNSTVDQNSTVDSTNSTVDPNPTIDSTNTTVDSTSENTDPSNSTLNSTISYRSPGVTVTSQETLEQSNQTNMTGIVLPVTLGALGGVLLTIGAFFFIRYAKRKLSSKKSQGIIQTSTPGMRRVRPPRLTYSDKPLIVAGADSLANSPELLKRGRLSLLSHNDSPLIRYDSPLKDISTPVKEIAAASSILQKYTKNAQPKVVMEEPHEFGLKIVPIANNEVEVIEIPEIHVEEKHVPVSISLPDLPHNIPEGQKGHASSIPDV